MALVTMAILAIVLGVMVLVSLVLVVHLVASSRNKVPPVFTPGRAIEEVIDALDLPAKGQLFDLGCGDGRVLEAALRRRPRTQGMGVENNPVVMGLAWLRLHGRAKLVLGQIENVRFAKVERVFAYLGPGLMAELEPRFERELPKGARVVSQQFPLPNRRPDQVVELKYGKAYAKELFIYDY